MASDGARVELLGGDDFRARVSRIVIALPSEYQPARSANCQTVMVGISSLNTDELKLIATHLGGIPALLPFASTCKQYRDIAKEVAVGPFLVFSSSAGAPLSAVNRSFPCVLGRSMFDVVDDTYQHVSRAAYDFDIVSGQPLFCGSPTVRRRSARSNALMAPAGRRWRPARRACSTRTIRLHSTATSG